GCNYRVMSLTCILQVFVIYCYRCHRDLRSFPTRRSSDLRRGFGGEQGEAAGNAVGEVGRFEPVAALGRPHPGAGDEFAEIAVAVDRKSTRLNSSHVKISYAVFCLKKKNKKKYEQSTRS